MPVKSADDFSYDYLEKVNEYMNQASSEEEVLRWLQLEYPDNTKEFFKTVLEIVHGVREDVKKYLLYEKLKKEKEKREKEEKSEKRKKEEDAQRLRIKEDLEFLRQVLENEIALKKRKKIKLLLKQWFIEEKEEIMKRLDQSDIEKDLNKTFENYIKNLDDNSQNMNQFGGPTLSR